MRLLSVAALAKIALAAAIVIGLSVQPGHAHLWVSALGSEHETTAQDWCKKLKEYERTGNYQGKSRQWVRGMCAHQQFEAKHKGSAVKYTRSGVGVVPDGRSGDGKRLYELKPNGSAAVQAVAKTSSVSGLKSIPYRWVYLGNAKFKFINVEKERAKSGYKAPGQNARATFKAPSMRGYGIPIARGGGAAGYRVKAEPIPVDAYEIGSSAPEGDGGFTDDEQKLLAEIEYLPESAFDHPDYVRVNAEDSVDPAQETSSDDYDYDVHWGRHDEP